MRKFASSWATSPASPASCATAPAKDADDASDAGNDTHAGGLKGGKRPYGVGEGKDLGGKRSSGAKGGGGGETRRGEGWGERS